MDDYTNPMTPRVDSTYTAAPTQTSGLAIASLVLGILAFMSCGCTGVVGLILGIVALAGISSSRDQVGGRGLAIAGIILSIIGTLIGLAIGAAMMLPAFTSARGQAQHSVMLSNARQLALAMVMYTEDNNRQFPDPDAWIDRIGPYHGNVQTMLSSPLARQEGRMWAMNSALKGLKLDDIARTQSVVMLFECAPDSPVCGGPELLAETPRSHRGYVIVFVDGHVESIDPMALDDLTWQP